MNPCTLFFFALLAVFGNTSLCFSFFLYQQFRESNPMLAIGTSVPIFALAGLCWCTWNFKFLVRCLPWVLVSKFLPLLASASVPGIGDFNFDASHASQCPNLCCSRLVLVHQEV